MKFTTGEISRGVSPRKYAEEGKEAFSIYASKRDPKGLCILIFVKLAGIQAFSVLWHPCFSIGLIPAILYEYTHTHLIWSGYYVLILKSRMLVRSHHILVSFAPIFPFSAIFG